MFLLLLVPQKCIRPLLKLLQDTKELPFQLKIEFLSEIYEQFEDRVSYRKMIQCTILRVISANNTMKKNDDDEDDIIPSILLKLPSKWVLDLYISTVKFNILYWILTCFYCIFYFLCDWDAVQAPS